MSERLFLGVMGFVLGCATFTAIGMATFLVITGVQERAARSPAPAAGSYAQVQPTSTTR
jgi:hypothetical protein